MKAQLIQGGRQYLGVSVYNQFSMSKPTIPSATVVHTTGQTHIGALAGFGAVVGAVVRGCFLTLGGCSPSAGGSGEISTVQGDGGLGSGSGCGIDEG